MNDSDPRLVRARGEKDIANQILTAAGVPVARQTFGNLKQIRPWIEKLGSFPVWLKPKKGTGNDGVSECHDMTEVEAAYRTITSRPTQLGVQNVGVLVEENLPGPEFICDYTYLNGEWVLAHISQYEKVPKLRPDGTLTNAYKRTRVLEGDGPIQSILVPYGASVLKPLGARTGNSHLEIKLTPSGPRLVEHNPRFVGAKFTKLINTATGFGPMELLVEALAFPDRFKTRIGQPPYKLRKQASLIHLNSDHSGRIVSTPYLEELRKHPAWQYDYISGAGDPLYYTIDVDSGAGIFYVAHEDASVLDEFEKRVLELMAQDAFFVYEPDRDERVRRAIAGLPEVERQKATLEMQRLHRLKDTSEREKYENWLLSL